jgi:uncharacterized membrane protein
MKWLVGGILAVLFLALLPSLHASCAVFMGDGFAEDTDCDASPDLYDNCPLIPNPDQNDLNRNGAGDSCDLIMDDIVVQPDSHVQQGELVPITIRLLNTQLTSYGNAVVRITNKDLNIDVSQTIPFIPPGETGTYDLWLKIPRCAEPKAYTITVTAIYTSTVKRSATTTSTITVEPGKLCTGKATTLQDSIINVLDRVDIDRGDRTIIPITVANLGTTTKSYQLSVQDLGSFGTWRIEPRTAVTLAPDEDETVYMYLDTESNVPAGHKTVMLTITSGKTKADIPIDVYVRVPLMGQGFGWQHILQVFLIIVLVILIIVAVITGLRAKPHMPPPPRKKVAIEKAEKVETYY